LKYSFGLLCPLLAQRVETGFFQIVRSDGDAALKAAEGRRNPRRWRVL
jgi:hypothetical protein